METALERSLLKLGKAEDYFGDVQRIYLDLTRQQRFDEVDALEGAVRLLDREGISYKFPTQTNIRTIKRPDTTGMEDGNVQEAISLCRHYGFEIGD